MSVRVVAGVARGRMLEAPDGTDTRPTSDRVREAVANALVSLGAVDGSRVLDLFAGSGALGIEALSRGADHATFVESDRGARAVVERNLAATGLADRALVHAGDAGGYVARLASTDRFDVVFLDPPYAFAGWDGLLASLAPHLDEDGVVVVESDREVEVPDGFVVIRAKRYGGTVVTFTMLRPSVPPPAHDAGDPE